MGKVYRVIQTGLAMHKESQVLSKSTWRNFEKNSFFGIFGHSFHDLCTDVTFDQDEDKIYGQYENITTANFSTWRISSEFWSTWGSVYAPELLPNRSEPPCYIQIYLVSLEYLVCHSGVCKQHNGKRPTGKARFAEHVAFDDNQWIFHEPHSNRVYYLAVQKNSNRFGFSRK